MKRSFYPSLLLSFLIATIFLSCTSISKISAKSSVYSVRDYGAKGNGTHDDTRAIKNCITMALKNRNAKIIFPRGNYLITEPLLFAFSGSNHKIIIEGQDASINFNKVLRNVLYLKNTASTGGDIKISGLAIEGQFSSATIDKLFDGMKYTYGLMVWNFDKTEISNCTFKDFYGGAIHTKQAKVLKQADWQKSTKTIINNNSIYNVFGMKATKYIVNGKVKGYDMYGDGIYAAGGKQGIISGNKINNDLFATKHFGRGGIVLGSASIDFSISNNTINGYERGIHIELTQGGHKIENNTITGFGTGILISAPDISSNLKPRSPMSILNNTLINSKLPSFKLQGCIRPSGHIYFYKSSTVIENSVVSGNKLEAVNKPFSGKFLFVSQQKKLKINNNSFIGVGKVKPAFYSHFGIKQFNNNTLKNLSYANCHPGAEESNGNIKMNVYSEFINKSKKRINK